MQFESMSLRILTQVAVLIILAALPSPTMAGSGHELCKVLSAKEKFDGGVIDVSGYISSAGPHGIWMRNDACEDLSVKLILEKTRLPDGQYDRAMGEIFRFGPILPKDRSLRLRIIGAYYYGVSPKTTNRIYVEDVLLLVESAKE